ncbi:hypothetical protein GM3708_1327 [Geminocystis sp. NIES-3708]|uniref:hypothetical protein n=1 Tax=Geminocystis sp. NIES-3708 TaxID=1615909 RepID=UPI0005FC52C7|nr:hypothetical protein [Geminocystis sp. NIES-3708]BAQ60921.1 hypothetical protein GM3708_1327 [Geminocystis sp. NIES-3708]
MKETKIILEQKIPVRLFITEEGEKLLSLNDLKKFILVDEDEKDKNIQEKELIDYLESLISEYPNLILSSSSEYHGIYYKEKNKNAKESLFYVQLSKKYYAFIYIKNNLTEEDLHPILHQITKVEQLTQIEIEERNNRFHPDYPVEELPTYHIKDSNVCYYIPKIFRDNFWLDLKLYIVSEIGEENYDFWNKQEFNPLTSKTKEDLFFEGEINTLNLPILNQDYWKKYKPQLQKTLVSYYKDEHYKNYIRYELDDLEYLAGLAANKEIKPYDEFFFSQLEKGNIFEYIIQRKYRDTITLKPKSHKEFISIMENIFEYRVGKYLDSKNKIFNSI